MENNSLMYTEEQLMSRLRFFIGICLAITLTGIVFVVLYSIIFVTQPLNAISPIDQKFFELIIPIATFLTGTLSGIMLSGGTKEETDAKLAMMKQAGDNQIQASKSTSPPPSVRSEPTFSGLPLSPAAVAAPINNVATSPAGVVSVGFGGKLSPPSAPQPEL